MLIFLNKKNKKGISIVIVFLVLTTLLLTSIALYQFITENKNRELTLEVPNSINSIYLKESYLDYYLDDIFEKSTKDFSSNQGKDVFIENFRNNLNEYKDKNGRYIMPELGIVERELNNFEIELDENKVVLNVDVIISDNYNLLAEPINNENREIISVSYNYRKRFEKVFKG